jgi:hypothetical protein
VLGNHGGAPFVTSSHSNPGDCIAVAIPAVGTVAVADSKDPNGPRLVFSRQVWADFVGFASAQQV